MKPLSHLQRNEVGEAAERYQEALWGSDGAEALSYLQGRGLSDESIAAFGLGVVAEPVAGHEKYRGRLCIPYWDMLGPTKVRFRALPGQPGNAKYLDAPGASPRMYNVTAIAKGGDVLHITEGEIDCITANQMGLNSVALPGVQAWHKRYRNLLAGYSVVRVLCDHDDSGVGLEMGERIKSELPDIFVQLLLAPEGHDVNSAYNELGQEELLAYWNLEVPHGMD